MDQFWLTDEQFAKIAPHLPTDTRCKGRVDDRRVNSGILYTLKSGVRSTDAPRDVYCVRTAYARLSAVGFNDDNESPSEAVIEPEPAPAFGASNDLPIDPDTEINCITLESRFQCCDYVLVC